MTYTIYTITHKETGQTYVGMTSKKPRVRWNQHLGVAMAIATGSTGRASEITRAMSKHGVDKFEFKVVETIEMYEEGIERENYWIEKVRETPASCYNAIASGGGKRSRSDPSPADLVLKVLNRHGLSIVVDGEESELTVNDESRFAAWCAQRQSPVPTIEEKTQTPVASKS